MYEALTAAPNLPFAVALGVMLVFALLEIIGMVFGVAFSGLIDSVLPDFDIDADLDVDLDAEIDLDLDVEADMQAGGVNAPTSGILVSIMSWLCIGQVPALILLIFFLTAFGLIGLGLQSTIFSTIGIYLPAVVASIPAFVLALPATRVFGVSFAKIMPKEETEAVSTKTFIGKVATITGGTATRDLAAQAKLHDSFGQAHYIMVEPDLEGDEFVTGTEVVVVKQVGSTYRVIKNTNAALQKD